MQAWLRLLYYQNILSADVVTLRSGTAISCSGSLPTGIHPERRRILLIKMIKVFAVHKWWTLTVSFFLSLALMFTLSNPFVIIRLMLAVNMLTMMDSSASVRR